MRRMRLLAIAAFSAFAAAQDVCVSGEVQPLGGPTICQQGETHFLVGTGVMLRGNGVALDPHVGTIVTVSGPDIGLLCHVIDVTQVVTPAPVISVSCGSPVPGCPLRVATQGPGLGLGLLAIGVGSAFQPLGCNGGPGTLDGTVLLGTFELLVVGQTQTGRVDTTLVIPSNQALVGVTVGFQGAHMTTGRQGPVRLSNLVEVTIVPFMPPCMPVNC
jgi:hypothetical protein